MAERPKEVKKRNWAIVVYPDSLPEDWVKRLRDTHLPCAISPLHDADSGKGGEHLKPHYHILLVWDGPVCESAPLEVAAALNAPPHVEHVKSLKGYYEYLWHKNEPEKVHYNEADVVRLNGFDVPTERTAREVFALTESIQNYIRETGIREYGDLLDALLDAGLRAEWEVATCKTILFTAYIRSHRHKGKCVGVGNE